MAELPPTTHRPLLTKENKKRTKEITEKRDHPRAEHPYSCPRSSVCLGGNFPTSVAARKSITAWSHFSMENSSQICTCWHLPAVQPVAFPTVFQSVFCRPFHWLRGGRDAPASVLVQLHTDSSCLPLGVQSAFGMLQSGHARSSVYRTL